MAPNMVKKARPPKVRYSDQKKFKSGKLSIFLAGPTPRSADVLTWRKEAVAILEKLGFAGTILVPERRDWAVKFDYTDQVEWEDAGLKHCTVAVFWVPREMKTMPALTTNVEFGCHVTENPEKVIYGRPDKAPSIRYLDWRFKKNTRRKPFNTLEATLEAAVKHANKLQKRKDAQKRS